MARIVDVAVVFVEVRILLVDAWTVFESVGSRFPSVTFRTVSKGYRRTEQNNRDGRSESTERNAHLQTLYSREHRRVLESCAREGAAERLPSRPVKAEGRREGPNLDVRVFARVNSLSVTSRRCRYSSVGVRCLLPPKTMSY